MSGGLGRLFVDTSAMAHDIVFHPKGPSCLELARQALSSTTRGYDLLAPKFDYTPFRTPQFVLDAVGRVIQQGANCQRSLDICCGTGAGMQTLRPLSAEVVGLDMSRGMLDVARKNSQDWEGDGTLHFVLGDALNPPSELGDSFDVAVCLGALGHILPSQQDQFLAKVHGLLRVGGSLYFVTTAHPPWWSLRHLLARGFNGAMHLRNLLIRPPFIMFYLTFLLPEIAKDLERCGFEVIVHEVAFPPPPNVFRVVQARRK